MASFFAAREAFATALSAVPGVNGYAWKPTTPKPGDAWVRRGRSERAAPGAFQNVWTIVLLLPGDERAQEQWTDERLEQLIDAVEGGDLAWIVSFETGTATDRPALLIECRE